MRYSLAILGSIVAMCCQHAAWADDFRIETKVYSGKSKTPVSQNVTLFDAGYVYDYLLAPERVAVFDQPHGRFVLLDPVRKLKAEVRIEDVRRFTDKFREVAEKSSRAFMRFAAEPDFNTEFSQDAELKMSSPYITYELKTEPAKTPEAAGQYREFSDWYARFNAMATPGSTPPFARIAVNEQLAERGLIPREVQLTIAASGGSKAVALRSEHHVSWRLLPRDHKRIAETGHQLATFRSVDFDKFEPLTATKPAAKSAR